MAQKLVSLVSSIVELNNMIERLAEKHKSTSLEVQDIAMSILIKSSDGNQGMIAITECLDYELELNRLKLAIDKILRNLLC